MNHTSIHCHPRLHTAPQARNFLKNLVFLTRISRPHATQPSHNQPLAPQIYPPAVPYEKPIEKRKITPKSTPIPLKTRLKHTNFHKVPSRRPTQKPLHPATNAASCPLFQFDP